MTDDGPYFVQLCTIANGCQRDTLSLPMQIYLGFNQKILPNSAKTWTDRVSHNIFSLHFLHVILFVSTRMQDKIKMILFEVFIQQSELHFLMGHSVLKTHPICFLLAGQHSICLTNVVRRLAKRLLSKLFFREIAASVQYFRTTAIWILLTQSTILVPFSNRQQPT